MAITQPALDASASTPSALPETDCDAVEGARESSTIVSAQPAHSPDMPAMSRVSSEPAHLAASSAASSPPPLTPAMRRKSLSFGSVNIREYSVTLGDNPSVSHGVPVSLGWKCVREASLPLQEYDDARYLAGRAVSPHDFCAKGRLSGQQRVALALRSGASVDDIRQSAEVVRGIQRRRVQSLPPHLGGSDSDGGYGGNDAADSVGGIALAQLAWNEWVVPPVEAFISACSARHRRALPGARRRVCQRRRQRRAPRGCG